MDPKQSHEFRQREQEEVAAQKQAKTGGEREFATPEELLRHDAANTPVPDSVTQRLQQTLAQEKPAKSWWRRLFGQ